MGGKKLRTILAALPWLVMAGVVTAAWGEDRFGRACPFQTLVPAEVAPAAKPLERPRAPGPRAPRLVTFEPWEEVPT